MPRRKLVDDVNKAWADATKGVFDKNVDEIKAFYNISVLPKRSPAGDKYVMVEPAEIYDDGVFGQQLKQLRQSQALDAAQRSQEQQKAMLQMQQAQAVNNVANQKSLDLGFLTSGDTGYFEQPPKYTFFKPIDSPKEESQTSLAQAGQNSIVQSQIDFVKGLVARLVLESLKEESAPVKPKPTKVDPKIHRRKLNIDD